MFGWVIIRLFESSQSTNGRGSSIYIEHLLGYGKSNIDTIAIDRMTPSRDAPHHTHITLEHDENIE